MDKMIIALTLTLGINTAFAEDKLLTENTKCEFKHAYFPGEIDQVFGPVFVDEKGAAIEGDEQKNAFTILRQKEQNLLNRARQLLCNYATVRNEKDFRLAKETGTGRYPPSAYERDVEALNNEMPSKLQEIYKKEKEILVQIEYMRVEKAREDKNFKFKFGGMPALAHLLSIQNKDLKKANLDTLTRKHLEFTPFTEVEMKDRMREARNGLYYPNHFNDKGGRIAKTKLDDELKKFEETELFAGHTTKIRKYNEKLAAVAHTKRSPAESAMASFTEDQLKAMPKEEVQAIVKDQITTLQPSQLDLIKDRLSDEQQNWIKPADAN